MWDGVAASLERQLYQHRSPLIEPLDRGTVSEAKLPALPYSLDRSSAAHTKIQSPSSHLFFGHQVDGGKDDVLKRMIGASKRRLRREGLPTSPAMSLLKQTPSELHLRMASQLSKKVSPTRSRLASPFASSDGAGSDEPILESELENSQ